MPCGSHALPGQSASSGQPPLLHVSHRPWMLNLLEAEEHAPGSAERLVVQNVGDQDLCRALDQRVASGICFPVALQRT